MSKTCGECTYLNIDPGKGDLYGKFPCEKKYERHLAIDPECDRFCTAYSRDYDSIKNAQRYSIDHSNERCYLTTMLCDILGMEDNNKYLFAMRCFRRNILQNDPKYKRLLVEYDIVGPKIAEALNNDPLKEQIAHKYFKYSIIPIINNINNNNINLAVEMYKSMTNYLKGFYGLGGLNATNLQIDSADIKSSGHGKYKVKKIAPNI